MGNRLIDSMHNSNLHSENSVIARSVSSADQIEHQCIITEDGRTIDLDQKHFNIIDEDGHIVFDADGEVIISIAKEQLNYGNFIKTYRQSSQKAMLLLLALQSNSSPLKRGGIDFAYMADILVDHMIVQFSEEANTIWEALSALQSSKPEDNYFRITAEDLKPYTNYKSNEALYNAFKKGCEELKKTNLEFDINDPEHDGHNIMIHWNDGAEWVGNNKKTGEKAHFDVYTNDFYRVLMSSSGIIHGAHWNRRIARSLKGYARSLYLFCARNKNYTKFKGAIPGRKEMTVEETRYELKIDNNTEPRGIWRRLKEAQDKINVLPDSEFSVSITKLPEKGKIEGFRFDIKENRIIDEPQPTKKIEDNQTHINNLKLYEEIKSLLGIANLNLSEKEIVFITNEADTKNLNGQNMMRIISIYQNRVNKNDTPIKSPAKYICSLINSQNNEKAKSNNTFNSFMHDQTNNIDDLENLLLDN